MSKDTDLKWIRKGVAWRPVPEAAAPFYHPKLERGLYEILVDDEDNPILMPIADGIKLPDIVYGLETDFISRALGSWKELPGNMGVLLTGLSGTGKTVTGKKIAIDSGLPVIFIRALYSWMPSFISQLPDEVCIFIDEVEKVVKWKQGEGTYLLTLMDGLLNGKKKLFIFTCNEMAVSEHLLNRPGRVRYVKRFESLERSILRKVIEHELKDKAKVEEVFEWCLKVENLSIDITRSVISEVNIHGTGPSTFEGVFNVGIKRVTEPIESEKAD